MSLGMYHLHERRRVGRAGGPYPRARILRDVLDRLMFVVGFVQPLALVPQVLAIYVHHATAGVSLVTWEMLTVFNVLWALYGYVHQAPPIMVANILLAVLDLSIVLGVLFY